MVRTRRMVSFLMLAAFAALAVPSAESVAQNASKNKAVIPNQRKDKGAVDRHNKFVDRAKKGDVDVLFLGDSITQGWEGNGKEAWKTHFEPLKSANFGIGGDKTDDVLWRLTEGKELDGIKPKACVLMIGTNNTGRDSAENIAEGVTAVVKELHKQRPEMKILLLAVFPRSGKSGKDLKMADRVGPDEFNKKIPEINKAIAKLDDGKTVKYLDIGPKFLNGEGALLKEVMPDFLHLSPKGYVLWAEAIKEPLAALLK
jgi:lysophospholipase L1-like esterase